MNFQSKISRLSISFFLTIFITLFVFSDPSFARSKKRAASAKKPFKVLITSMGGDYSTKLKKNKNQHPYDIPEAAFLRILNNFDYQFKRRSLSGWEKKKRRVFPPKVASSAAKYLRKAFLKANSSQKIVFTHFSPTKGNTLVDIFIQREKINFKFMMVHGNGKATGRWIISKGYLMHYFGTGTKLLSVQGIFGGGNFIDACWIRIPLIQYIAEVKGEGKLLKASGGKKGSSFKGKNKLVKLKKLTSLFHRSLISKEDYLVKVDKVRREKAGETLTIEEELEYIKILKDEKFITRDAYLQKKNVLLENYD